jgi:hypothetical protein
MSLKNYRISDRPRAEQGSIGQVGQVEGLKRDAVILCWLHFESRHYMELGVVVTYILRFGDGSGEDFPEGGLRAFSKNGRLS